MQQGKSESIKTESGDVRLSQEGDKVRVEHSGPIVMDRSQARSFAERVSDLAESGKSDKS